MSDPKKFLGIIPELIHRVVLLADGVLSIFEGLELEVEGVAKSAVTLVDHVGGLIMYLAVLGATTLTCSIYYISNIRACFIYYLLEIFGQLLYLPVRVLAWIIKMTKLINPYPYLDLFWGYMEKLDMFIYTYCKFHIIHYPRSVREKCYVCKRLKQSTVATQGGILADDFAPGGIAQDLTAGGEKLMHGVMDIVGVFAPLF
jgi:hypothetical protein